MDIKKEPLLLVLQIDPDTGKFVEAAIHFSLSVDDRKSRHELWWHKITDGERRAVQKLVDSAVEDMLT